MDISKTIAALKQEPGFTENVGMVLVHNGVVRDWSRKGREKVARLKVSPDRQKIESIRAEFEQRPGIFRIVVTALEGEFLPGDDLLYIIVAGDVRENVVPTLAELLNRVKAEAVHKVEVFQE